MNRFLQVVYLAVFFTALALPSMCFFGADETRWHKIYGAERCPKLPGLTFKGFADRSYQSTLTEYFAKSFYLRHTFYTTARQINEYANFGLSHPVGYKGKTIEGKAFDDRNVGIIFEEAYVQYHLRCNRRLRPEKFARTIALLKDFDEFCRTNGMDFVFQSVPDKPQTYADYLPEWLKLFWNYENYPIQPFVAENFNAAGVKTIDGLTFFRNLRKETKTWLYPPGGAHMTCLAAAKLEEEIVRRVNAAGRIRLEANPIVDVVEKPDGIWSVDNDISLLLNCWKNVHIDTNCHYFPVFRHKDRVMNEGSAFILGDCFREQMQKIFIESGLFAKDKVKISKRKNQKPEDFKDIIKDLKLVVLSFQSFNSALLNDDEQFRREPDYDLYAELESIFTALREAVRLRMRPEAPPPAVCGSLSCRTYK